MGMRLHHLLGLVVMELVGTARYCTVLLQAYWMRMTATASWMTMCPMEMSRPTKV